MENLNVVVGRIFERNVEIYYIVLLLYICLVEVMEMERTEFEEDEE